MPPGECWSAPVPFPGLEAGATGENGPWLSSAGTELFFGQLVSDADHDIYRATFANGSWTASDLVTLNITLQYDDDPFFDEDQGVLWFSRNSGQGTPGHLYEAPRIADTTFSPIVAHGEISSTKSVEPSVTDGGKTVYFSPNGMMVSRATRPDATPLTHFDAPTPLTCDDVIEAPSIATDGATIFFTDHSQATMERIARGRIAGDRILDVELVGTFQTDAAADYFDPFISRDGKTLAFAIDHHASAEDVPHLYYVTSGKCP